MASIRSIARSARNSAAPTSSALRLLRPTSSTSASTSQTSWLQRRCASSSSSSSSSPSNPTTQDPEFEDLEYDSSFLTPALPETTKFLSPQERVSRRNARLPGSRYQFHPPKYDRGPLHPIQSPPSSDPTARDFVPGPFHQARLRQTYHSTIASDIMTLAYMHSPPGSKKNQEPTPDRLRSWDGSSPYHKNRPKRGPRGDPSLPLLERDITFRNIPELRSVTVAAFVPEAIKDSDRLIVARMVMQSVTGVLPEITEVKRNVAQWGIIKGQRAGVKATLYGNDAYDFLDKCIHLVFPRIKEWKGVKGSTGDSSGNLAWGLTSTDVALFPEIESNYSMFPAKMIPGFRVFVETTAKSDRHARLLLGSFGVPFEGELRD